jgi:TDG/mug DNA glycosylase family protein
MTVVAPLHGLPDILAPHLSVVFCGINPGLRAATSGHHFDGQSNRFWRTIHLAGFTPRELAPEQDHTLTRYRCGLTTVVARATTQAKEVSPQEFFAAAAGLEEKLRRHEPCCVAFLGKAAFAGMQRVRDVPWGRQPESFAGVMAWVLPNPSGLNRAFGLDALVAAYRELRMELWK